MIRIYIPGTDVCIITNAKCACSAIKKSVLLHIVGKPMPNPHGNGLHQAMAVFSTPMPGINYSSYQFIRNPVDRIISAYRDKVHYSSSRFNDPNMSFSDFLNNVVTTVQNQHWCIQVPLYDSSVKYLRIEDGIQQHLDMISSNHGLKPFNVDYTHVTPDHIPNVTLTQSDIDFILSFYANDFLLYPEVKESYSKKV